MSSSRRPPKKPARAKAAAKRAPAKPKTAGKTASKSAKQPAPSARPAGRAPVEQAKGARQKKVNIVRKAALRPAEAAKKPHRVAATLPPPPAPKPPVPPPRPAIRLAGSASRLTIKPGAPIATRPQLELSTKKRPTGPRRLSDVELDEDEVLIDAFDALLDGDKVRITAVLERTCVYVGMDGDRRLARKIDLWVEADKLPIRRRWMG